MAVELKQLQDEMLSAFDALKKMGEQQDTEIKKLGQPIQETKAQIININEAMDKIKGRIDLLETKTNRTDFAGEGNAQEDPQAAEKKAAFFKFIKGGLGDLSREEKALVQDTTGDILVPYDLDQTIYRAIPQLNVLRSLMSIRNTNSDRIRRVNMNEATAGWGKIETSGATKLANFESTLTPTEAFAYVEDAYALTKIGEDELEDSHWNLQQYMADTFALAYANLEETGFLKGTGHAAGQPEGLLNGTTLTRKTTGAAGTLTADDFLKLMYDVQPIVRQSANSCFCVNAAIELQMRLMKDSQGRYLWEPSLQANTPSTFAGKQVCNVAPMDSTVATGKEVAIFGDFKLGYQIIDKQQGSLLRIGELYLNDGLIGFRYKRRVGGYVMRPDAFRVLKIQ